MRLECILITQSRYGTSSRPMAGRVWKTKNINRAVQALAMRYWYRTVMIFTVLTTLHVHVHPYSVCWMYSVRVCTHGGMQACVVQCMDACLHVLQGASVLCLQPYSIPSALHACDF